MWFIFSIFAAILWGLNYVFNEKILEHISISTAVAIFCFFTSLTMATYSLLTKSFVPDINKIIHSHRLLILVLLEIITLTLGELMISSSIQAKNATVASLIELSYPLFVILFSYLIYKEVKINYHIAFGGILIFMGAFLIYFFSK